MKLVELQNPHKFVILDLFLKRVATETKTSSVTVKNKSMEKRENETSPVTVEIVQLSKNASKI